MKCQSAHLLLTAIGGLAVILAPLVLIGRPYRLETLSVVVSGNLSGCTIHVTTSNGWRRGPFNVGRPSEILREPIEPGFFIDECAGLQAGRPDAAELRAAGHRAVIATGLSCGNASQRDGPCRLETPPQVPLSSSTAFVIRVRRQRDGDWVEVPILLDRSMQWRSATIDMIMSV